MAKKEKALNDLSLEDVRIKLGYAIGYIHMYAENQNTLEMVLKEPNMAQKFFATVHEAKETSRELAKRFGIPANYAEEIA